MTKWMYKKVTCDGDGLPEMNLYGSDGWEVVQYDTKTQVFPTGTVVTSSTILLKKLVAPAILD